MGHGARNIGIAALVLLIIIATSWWLDVANTPAVQITALNYTDKGVVTLTGTTLGPVPPGAWDAKRVAIHTKALGTIHSVVSAATSTVNPKGYTDVFLVTMPGAYVGTRAYTADLSDHALVRARGPPIPR